MTNITEELMAKARGAKSADELLALAKENGVEFTEEQAKAYFEQMNQSGELEDSELDSVAGGGCYKGNRLVVSLGYSCGNWTCEKCGSSTCVIKHFKFHTCDTCQYCSYEKGLWLCNHPRNRK